MNLSTKKRSLVKVRRNVNPLRLSDFPQGWWQLSCPDCPYFNGVSTEWEQAIAWANEHARTHRPLTPADPVPPVGTIVLDDCGVRWERIYDDAVSWQMADAGDDLESWTKVAGNYGPVRVLEWGL
jgi:hypothetical protein